jgi:uridine kinase
MIGITGVARSGKDTLYSLLERKFKEKNINTKRFALADNLKKDLNNFIIEKFNINLDSVSTSEKELIRPILVAYGKSKRQQTSGRYWIELLNKEIINQNELPIVTDVRYDEYERDEYSWLKKEKKGILIHISRIYNGKIIEPANDEEYRNNLRLVDKADYKFMWCTEPDLKNLYYKNESNLEEIYELYSRP